MSASRLALALLLGLLAGNAAHALTFVVGQALPQIYLRIGQTGGTVTLVTMNLTGSESILGNGTPIYGTVPAAAGAANAETANFPACAANHVRIVARARSIDFLFPITATLQVNSSTALVHGPSGNTIPFTEIGWDSDEPSDFPSGAFTGGVQVLSPAIPSSRETGACHRFKFLNTQVYPSSAQGTGYYQGTVVYNLSSP
jgi:hypothetical protein